MEKLKNLGIPEPIILNFIQNTSDEEALFRKFKSNNDYEKIDINDPLGIINIVGVGQRWAVNLERLGSSKKPNNKIDKYFGAE